MDLLHGLLFAGYDFSRVPPQRARLRGGDDRGRPLKVWIDPESFTDDERDFVKQQLNHKLGWTAVRPDISGFTLVPDKRDANGFLMYKHSEDQCRRAFIDPHHPEESFSYTKYSTQPPTIVINAKNWETTPENSCYGSSQLEAYRTYLINHEVGHALGYGHQNKPIEGALYVSIMMQQTIQKLLVKFCSKIPNPYPANSPEHVLGLPWPRIR